MKQLALLLLLTGCGINDDVSAQLTIVNGVYGQLLAGCDTPTCGGGYSSGVSVSLASSLPDGGVAAAGSTTTDGQGFYQLAADAGAYRLCAYAGGVCTEVVLPEGRLRVDHTSGPGGGIWRVRDGG